MKNSALMIIDTFDNIYIKYHIFDSICKEMCIFYHKFYLI